MNQSTTQALRSSGNHNLTSKPSLWPAASPQWAFRSDEDAHTDTLLNPMVSIEVLSKSTQSYDRGEKFEHDRTLSSLHDYLLVSQDKVLVEYFARQPDKFWLFSEARQLQQVIRIASINCKLPLTDIYEKVHFDE